MNRTLTANKLLELLEVPQLMETCVRHSFYDEAIELLSFASNLSKMHRNNTVIQKLVRYQFPMLSVV